MKKIMFKWVVNDQALTVPQCSYGKSAKLVRSFLSFWHGFNFWLPARNDCNENAMLCPT